MLYYPQCNTTTDILFVDSDVMLAAATVASGKDWTNIIFTCDFGFQPFGYKNNNKTHWLCCIPFHNDALVLSCVRNQAHPFHLQWCPFAPPLRAQAFSRAVACLVQLDLRWQTETERYQQAQVYTYIGRACIGVQYALWRSQNLILTS